MKLKEIFEELVAVIKLAGVKHVMLYNTSLTDKPLGFPHAWIQFNRIEHDHLTGNKTRLNTSADVHLMLKSISESDLTYFTHRDEVMNQLILAGYQIDSEQQDTNHDEVIDWVISISVPPTIEEYGA
jgi:hypothetical protein